MRGARASRDLLGSTAVLLYVAYSSAAQTIVGDIACRLARRGGLWDRAAVAELRSKLLSLPPCDAGRRRGRLAKQSGPLWLKRLLRSRGGCGALLRIGRHVGGFCCRAPRLRAATATGSKQRAQRVPRCLRSIPAARAEVAGHRAIRPGRCCTVGSGLPLFLGRGSHRAMCKRLGACPRREQDDGRRTPPRLRCV